MGDWAWQTCTTACELDGQRGPAHSAGDPALCSVIPGEVGWGAAGREGQRDGLSVDTELIPFFVQPKLIQHCNAIIPQVKHKIAPGMKFQPLFLSPQSFLNTLMSFLLSSIYPLTPLDWFYSPGPQQRKRK